MEQEKTWKDKEKIKLKQNNWNALMNIIVAETSVFKLGLLF